MVCFSCGKSGHTATRCPNLNEAFRFLQPGWRTESFRLEAGDKSGYELYPGQSTYGGEYLPGAFGSGGVPGQWN